jgi:hypothetical protein
VTDRSIFGSPVIRRRFYSLVCAGYQLHLLTARDIWVAPESGRSMLFHIALPPPAVVPVAGTDDDPDTQIRTLAVTTDNWLTLSGSTELQ